MEANDGCRSVRIFNGIEPESVDNVPGVAGDGFEKNSRTVGLF